MTLPIRAHHCNTRAAADPAGGPSPSEHRATWAQGRSRSVRTSYAHPRIKPALGHNIDPRADARLAEPNSSAADSARAGDSQSPDTIETLPFAGASYPARTARVPILSLREAL
jgi:hypothetical protein